MITPVQWTDEQRQVESDLGVAEIRKRIAELVPAERYETLVRFTEQDIHLTPDQSQAWAKLAATLAYTYGPRGEPIMIHGHEIIRQRSMDELALLVVKYEMYRRDIPPQNSITQTTDGHPHKDDDGQPTSAFHTNWKEHDKHPVHRHTAAGRTSWKAAPDTTAEERG